MEKRIVIAVLLAFGTGVAALMLGMYLGIHAVEVKDVPMPPERTLAEKCEHLYDTDRHKDWAACMGVPYR